MKNLYLLLSGLLVINCLHGQTPELFADINQVSPQNFASTGQKIHATSDELFYTSDIRSLAVYDGSDFIKYDQVEFPKNFITIGSRTYFVGTGSVSGDEELWYYEAGNINTVEVNPLGSSSPDFLTVYNGDLYFQANGGTNGIELWKYDGSALTEFDMLVGANSSEPKNFIVYGGELVFFAADDVVGREPRSYDGTTISLIEDVRIGTAGSVSSNNPYFEVHQGSLFFTANDGTGNELWEYDGTDVTKIDINTSGPSTPLYTTSFGSNLYTSASTTDSGYELWKYDGTSASLVEDIQPGSVGSVPTAPDGSNFFVSGGNMYFLANNGTNGEELFKFDGTTLTLIDINDNPDFSLGRSLVENMVEFDEQIFFTALTEDDGYELRSYDGTSITTYDIRSGSEGSNVSELTLFGESLIFGANAGDGTSFWHLWKYDENGARAFGSSTEESSSPEYFVSFDEKIYFTATDGINGNNQIWVTDGSSVETLEGLPQGYYFSDIRLLNNQITFYGEGDDDEKQFFYDGSNLTSIDIILNGAIEYQGDIYFIGETPQLGHELFRYDGTDTTLIADIRPGPLSSSTSNLIVFNDKLVFTGDDGTNGKLLWEYDGTSVQLIEDINSGFTNTNYGDFAIVGRNLFFAGFSSNNGFELYRYDGSDVTIFEINSGPAGSSPQEFLVYNDQLVFQANDDGDIEMFIHDGSTVNKMNINESGSSSPSDFTVFNDKVYFAADDGVNGSELMEYDGTSVSLAADINVGSGDSEIEDPFVNGPYLYFKAYNFDRPTDAYEKPLNSLEELNGLFRFDGENFDFVTAEIDYEFDATNGTIPIILDNYIYFSGESNASGNEVFRMRAISQEADIVAFAIAEQVEDALINSEAQTISVLVPAGTEVSDLNPTINISEFAEIDLDGAQDFTDPVVYTVTSEFGNSKDWIITVEIGAFNGTDILSFVLAAQIGDADINSANHTVMIAVESNTDLTNLEPMIGLSNGATISPTGPQDFTSPVSYTVTAESGAEQDWTVTIIKDETLGYLEIPIKIYPNPTEHLITIESIDMISIKLLDLNGKTLRSKSGRDLKLNIKNLPVGTYILKINNGESTQSRRIIKAN